MTTLFYFFTSFLRRNFLIENFYFNFQLLNFINMCSNSEIYLGVICVHFINIQIFVIFPRENTSISIKNLKQIFDAQFGSHVRTVRFFPARIEPTIFLTNELRVFHVFSEHVFGAHCHRLKLYFDLDNGERIKCKICPDCKNIFDNHFSTPFYFQVITISIYFFVHFIELK